MWGGGGGGVRFQLGFATGKTGKAVSSLPDWLTTTVDDLHPALPIIRNIP